MQVVHHIVNLDPFVANCFSHIFAELPLTRCINQSFGKYSSLAIYLDQQICIRLEDRVCLVDVVEDLGGQKKALTQYRISLLSLRESSWNI